MAGQLSDFLKKHWLFCATMLSLPVGIGLGVLMRGYTSLSTLDQLYFSFPGEVLTCLLKMITLPLIVCNMITGVAAMDVQTSGRIGLGTVIYTLTTSTTATILGVVLVLAIKPGMSPQSTEVQWARTADALTTVDTMLDLIRNLFPENLVQACFQHEYKLVGSYTNGINILGVIVFCILLGLAVGRMGKRGRRFVEFFNALNKAVMKIVQIMLCYMPVGIVFLIATKILAMENWSVFRTLGWYIVTVITGLLIHSTLVLPLLYVVLVQRNPYTFMWGMAHALLTAFTVSSSSATLPLTLQCAEQNNGIDRRVTRFILPIGATVNKNGSAFFNTVAAIFIAQMNNYPLDAGQITIIGIMAIATSIAGAALPSAAMVTTIITLTAVGLPINDIPLLIIVEWLLDRCRTVVNVMGDAFGAGILEKCSQKELQMR
ncbi:excitatory amino acid transporter 3-like isoform X2 [Electrophorus electricus]|uniref:excitatory amino acid transporter 3-like isoform X2 n=1 Tax=Electrophorus electricus TaxID=8005 RepID=UPI0015D067B8|nr:excitatory amino acid transporter 3-like isoform X2 [Electrophorus electricus]